MTDLFIATHLSELFVYELLASNDKLVICPPGAETELGKLGIQPIVFEQDRFSPEIRDAEFAQVAMPGQLGKARFPGTDLEAWKVLSIDRMRFWYDHSHKQWQELLSYIDFDRLVIPLVLQSVLPWVAAKEAKRRRIPVTAVKVLPLLRNIYLDMFQSASVPLDDVVVSDIQERTFFSSKVKNIKFKVSDAIGTVQVPDSRAGKSDEIRKDTLGIYFSPEYDWKFLALYSGLQTPKQIIIGMEGNRAWEKFIETFPEIASDPAVLLSDAVALLQCEEVLIPTFIEHFIRELPVNVNLSYYDIAKTTNAHLFKEVRTAAE